MQITIRTLKNGTHSVWIKGFGTLRGRAETLTFAPDGGTQVAGTPVGMTERTAVAGAVAAHKGLCWSRGKCQGHDVAVG